MDTTLLMQPAAPLTRVESSRLPLPPPLGTLLPLLITTIATPYTPALPQRRGFLSLIPP
ncbi:hypothetical protein VE04_06471, partial [Pseudogymnoascus sp. 24MN13]